MPAETAPHGRDPDARRALAERARDRAATRAIRPETTSRRDDRLDQPLATRRSMLRRPQMDADAFGKFAETFARFMGTARFLAYMTMFVVVWLLWNVFAPEHLRWDPYAFIFLTLMLSLQASYAAPLILLAQNRQVDRDKVMIEQDRTRDERALADTEFLTREVAALRIALRDAATRDFIRSELRGLLEELSERGVLADDEPEPTRGRTGDPSAGA